MSEFLNDAQRDAYLAALAQEKKGYEAREAAAAAHGNKDLAALMKSRQEQVQGEIDRLTADAEDTGDEPKGRSRRAKAAADEAPPEGGEGAAE